MESLELGLWSRTPGYISFYPLFPYVAVPVFAQHCSVSSSRWQVDGQPLALKYIASAQLSRLNQIFLIVITYGGGRESKREIISPARIRGSLLLPASAAAEAGYCSTGMKESRGLRK